MTARAASQEVPVPFSIGPFFPMIFASERGINLVSDAVNECGINLASDAVPLLGNGRHLDAFRPTIALYFLSWYFTGLFFVIDGGSQARPISVLGRLVAAVSLDMCCGKHMEEISRIRKRNLPKSAREESATFNIRKARAFGGRKREHTTPNHRLFSALCLTGWSTIISLCVCVWCRTFRHQPWTWRLCIAQKRVRVDA